MKNQIICIDELQRKESIIKRVTDEFKGRAFVIPTTDIFRNKAKWADRVVEEVYNCNRRDMESFSYHFSYIKFARNMKNNVVCGIVGGKGQFHWKNSSDVCFFDIQKYNNAKSKFMREYNMQWCTEEIVILKNINDLDRREAFANERYLQQKFSLFD